MPNPRQIYLNLPTRNLVKAKAFFENLGFHFNLTFTDDKAACMIISDQAYVMLLLEPFFKTFTKNEICVTATHTEALIAISCDTRRAVDEMVQKALASGGKAAMESKDHGWMYTHSFYDLDGHHWELLWMDPAGMPAEKQ
ncbi:VOC family protein [Bryobacter aggregatus]|uniref:VOC family protein n=1 Tax=Bryobacter aggregatus TaxID=360054 RepID=UPI0004E187FD|nr:VOC family protein [Bryobacter aggregatus]